MKLLLCKECQSIFNLSLELKTCSCGGTKGQYTDNLNAWWSGSGIPLCISNPSISNAILYQKYDDRYEPELYHGSRFDAWVCPGNSETYKEEVR